MHLGFSLLKGLHMLRSEYRNAVVDGFEPMQVQPEALEAFDEPLDPTHKISGIPFAPGAPCPLPISFEVSPLPMSFTVFALPRASN